LGDAACERDLPRGAGALRAAVYHTGMPALPRLDAAALAVRPPPALGESPGGPPSPDASIDALAEVIADALHTAGACWIADWPPAPQRAALRGELLALEAAGALRPAAVGREAGRSLRGELRGDRTLWLDDAACGAPARGLLEALDALRIGLNQRLFLGLAELEAHYALYPPGAGYVRHRDRFRDSDARRVSWVTYLNADWHEADGGALRLWPDDGGAPTDLLPVGGSVCFLSEREHAVLPAQRERLSIAGWFRLRG
jgi:SM-20-related protein